MTAGIGRAAPLDADHEIQELGDGRDCAAGAAADRPYYPLLKDGGT